MDVFDSGAQVADSELDLGTKKETKGGANTEYDRFDFFRVLIIKIRKEGGFKNDSHH
jgi:hypothetical protein